MGSVHVTSELALQIDQRQPSFQVTCIYTCREFEVPWFSLDKRELIERKGKVKPGRGRGKTRGKRKGYF